MTINSIYVWSKKPVSGLSGYLSRGAVRDELRPLLFGNLNLPLSDAGPRYGRPQKIAVLIDCVGLDRRPDKGCHKLLPEVFNEHLRQGNPEGRSLGGYNIPPCSTRYATILGHTFFAPSASAFCRAASKSSCWPILACGAIKLNIKPN